MTLSINSCPFVTRPFATHPFVTHPLQHPLSQHTLCNTHFHHRFPSNNAVMLRGCQGITSVLWEQPDSRQRFIDAGAMSVLSAVKNNNALEANSSGDPFCLVMSCPVLSCPVLGLVSIYSPLFTLVVYK